jgi:hypothetical protein
MTLTPEQFSKIALKEDLKGFAKSAEVQQARNDILASNDKLAKKLDDIEHAFVTNQAAHDRYEERITRIEKHLDLKPLFDY